MEKENLSPSSDPAYEIGLCRTGKYDIVETTDTTREDIESTLQGDQLLHKNQERIISQVFSDSYDY